MPILSFLTEEAVRFLSKYLSVIAVYRHSICYFAESYDILHLSEQNAGGYILIWNIAAHIITIKFSRVNTAL